MSKIVIRSLLLILFVFSLIFIAKVCGATTVTGTVKFQGQPLTGYYDVALSYPGTTGTYIALPGADPSGHTPISNGSIGTFTLEGNDTLLPRGTYYQFTFYDAYANPVSSLKYVITGSTFDIGIAVPTPITPANINYLDLLGLRNVSAQNLTISNQIQIGTGAILSALGLSNAKLVNDIRFAAAYAATSTTCGIQEALASLPTTGGTIWLQLGVCTVTTPITIAKPVRILGHGRGGGQIFGSTLPSPTVLVNAQPAHSLFTIQPSPVTATLSGVEMSDFAILGNSTVAGASAGDCISVVGGSPANGQISDVTLDAMFVYGCFAHGLHVSDGVHNTTVTRSYFAMSLGSGIRLDSPNAGLLTNTTIATTRSTSNSLDGLTVMGATVGAVIVKDSSFASNLVDGVNVVSGSVAANLNMRASLSTDNHSSGLLIADGQGSVVADSQFTPGTHQLFGINAPLPAISDTFATQLTLRDNLLQGNLTFDLVEGASTTYLLFYPQTERLGGTGTNYSLLNPGAVHSILPFTAVSRTCGAGGCYRVENDGTIEEWGVAAACGSGTPGCATSVTFPLAFTTTTNQTITATCGVEANCAAVVQSPSTTGFTAQQTAFVIVGGSGGNLSGSQTVEWYAVGH